MLSTAPFTQSLHAATQGSVSTRDWESSTLGDGSTTSVETPRVATQHRPVTVPVRPKQTLAAGIKSLMMSSKQRYSLAAELCQACEFRNLNKVAELLAQHHAPVNAATKDGKRPLHSAIRAGQFTIVKLLVDNGADVNKEDSNKDVPLGVAVQVGNEAIAVLLIQSGANVSGTSGTRGTILSLAISKKDEALVRLLIQNGANVTPDWPDSSHSTLLASAVAAGHEKIVHLLLQTGADCQIHTPGQISLGQKSLPLVAAVKARNLEVCRHLLQFGADADQWSDKKEYGNWDELALCALVRDDLDIALLLLEHGARIDLSKHALKIIKRQNKSETVAQLLKAGIGTSLSEEELMEIAKEDQDLARPLLDHGQLRLRLDDASGHGTALISAIMDGNVGLMELLLDYGAKPHGPQKDGFTPLCAALFRHEFGGRMVDLLLSRGADPNERCAEIIFAHPRSVYVDESYMETPLDVSYDTVRGDHPLFYDTSGYKSRDVSPLHIAVQFRCWCCDGAIKSLIQHGADVNAAYSHNQSEAQLTRQRKDSSSNSLGFTNISVLHLATKETQLKLLLEAGASVAARDGLGHTPLSWAVYCGAFLTIDPLLDAGSSVVGCSPGGKDALELWLDELNHNMRANQEFGREKPLWEHVRMLLYLVKHGADPRKSLKDRSVSVLTDITWEAEKGSKHDTEYRRFLHTCRKIMTTPDQAARIAIAMEYK